VPSERATKRLAKIKLSALHVAHELSSGHDSACVYILRE
jgi:hypothetical protein